MKKKCICKYHIAGYAILLSIIISCLTSCNSNEKKGESTDTTTTDSSTTIPDKGDVSISPGRFNEELLKFDSLHIDGKAYYLTDTDLLLSKEDLFNEMTNNTPYEKKYIGRAIMLFDTAENDYVKWRKFPVRYCIDKASFNHKGTDYENLKASVSAAAQDWKDACGVSFAHLSALDTKKNVKIGAEVDFIISYKNKDSLDFVATSFHPEQTERLLFVLPKYWKCEYNKAGVFRHELGHVLGFRHEEAYSNATIAKFCRQPADPLDKPVDDGDYDPVSVMHYFCGGKGTKDFLFSEQDKTAFLKVYPKK